VTDKSQVVMQKKVDK